MAFFNLFGKKKNQNEVKENVEETAIEINETEDDSDTASKPEELHDVTENVIESHSRMVYDFANASETDTAEGEKSNSEEPESELFDSESDDYAESGEEDGSSGKKQKKSFFQRIIDGLDKTRKNILGNVDNVLKRFVKIDDEMFDELEEALIMADIGVTTVTEIITSVKDRVKTEKITVPEDVKQLIVDEITKMLEENHTELEYKSPTVLLVVGVNGVGKTTSIGKLANNFKKEGKRVVIGAADTFRAAAIDQLEVWCNRSGVEMIKHNENADPGAVVYDAVHAAKARKADMLIIDTAGRLHNKKNLMEELKKIFRIISTQYPEAHREVFLVLDATTGQNALQQAKLFKEAADITGIILTKLDSTAKGGVIIAIKNELKVPVRYIGIGEGISAMQRFDAKDFAKALFYDEKNRM